MRGRIWLMLGCVAACSPPRPQSPVAHRRPPADTSWVAPRSDAPAAATAPTLDREQAAPNPEAFRARVRAADELVAELAAARDWARVQRQAASALHALADALRVAPDVGGSNAGAASSVRLAATQLERADVTDQDRVDHARAGLIAAVQALEELAPAGSASHGAVMRARRAVYAIDPRATLAFQRAPLQEAFRAVVDAFIAISRRSAQRA